MNSVVYPPRAYGVSKPLRGCERGGVVAGAYGLYAHVLSTAFQDCTGVGIAAGRAPLSGTRRPYRSTRRFSRPVGCNRFMSLSRGVDSRVGPRAALVRNTIPTS